MRAPFLRLQPLETLASCLLERTHACRSLSSFSQQQQQSPYPTASMRCARKDYPADVRTVKDELHLIPHTMYQKLSHPDWFGGVLNTLSRPE